MVIVQQNPSELAAPRKASRETRRQQLIEATIETIAVRGYARTTLTDVATLAGLSHGLVNFHFQTKEKLLSETLRFLAAEYAENWTTALGEAAIDPASQLDALLAADFNQAICSPSRLAAWCAFWGEAQSRPLYQQECASNDETYNRHLENLCAELLRLDGNDLRAERVARVLRVTSEGVWLDMMTLRTPYSRDEARQTLYTCAAAFFPRHFQQGGLITVR